MDNIKVALPRYVVGLENGDPFHSVYLRDSDAIIGMLLILIKTNGRHSAEI